MIACSCEVCLSADKRDKRLRSSIMIESGSKVIVIDTGPDFRYQMLRERVQRLDAVVFTHSHKDHIAGLDDIRAFNFRQQAPIDVYADVRVQEALKREYYYIFSEPRYPGTPEITIHTIGQTPFEAAGIAFTPIEVLHYKLPVLGFRTGDFTYITDAKTISPREIDKVRGTRILVVNALQKQSHISHFTLTEAISFAQAIGAEQTYFTHISHRLGKYNDVMPELPPGIALAYDGLKLDV